VNEAGPLRAHAGLRRSLRVIRAIMRRELIDVLRDRRSLFLTFLYPISMLIMYGYGIRYDVDNVHLMVLDHSETPASRALVQELTSSGYFRLVAMAADEREVERALATERARAAVVIPRAFAAEVRGGKPTSVQVLIDGSDANTANIAQGYALAIVNRFAAGLEGASESAAPIEVEHRVWYNPELKSVNFIVPGVIAVIMMIVGAILTALSIVKEKERGTIEQILVSPIRPVEMIVGKIVPYVGIALLDLAIIIAAGYLLFEVPIKGSLFSLAVFSLLYLVCSLGVGVFVSTIADNMQTAMIAAIFLSLMPSVLLSGFVFPLEHMPVAIQVVSYFFPGRYFVDAIRGIYLKGIGVAVLWQDALLLTLFALAIVGLSTSRFRDRLE
jgi:ABC-2 type transport system permease protein